MTPLRQHLLSLRRAHRAAGYPGDLAAHVRRGPARDDPWQRAWRIVASGAMAALVTLALYFYRQPALDGAAALGSSVDSIKQLAQNAAFWRAGQAASADAAAGSSPFRIAPGPLPFAAPISPARAPAATQESA